VAASDGDLRIIRPVRLGERKIVNALIEPSKVSTWPSRRHLGNLTPNPDFAISSYVRKQKTDRRDAKHILQLLVEGKFPRIWIPGVPLLMSQPGVGAVTALAFVLTLGDVHRFPRGKQVAILVAPFPRVPNAEPMGVRYAALRFQLINLVFEHENIERGPHQ
jgi:hypothetical protein